MSSLTLKEIIEAILFVAGRPVDAGEILAILERAPLRIPGRRSEIEEALEVLVSEWQGRGGCIRLERVAGGYEFRTDPQAGRWLELVNPHRMERFSTPAAETLALIAYRQPITRAEIEQLRGVDSAGVLKGLLEKRLIRVVGRKEEVGRPLLYASSKEFLELFGLKDLNDLPSLSELEERVQVHPEEPAPELSLDDLMSSPVDLADLEAGDREVLGELDDKLTRLKEVEKQVLEKTQEPDLDKDPIPT